jgi:hypothetical protein
MDTVLRRDYPYHVNPQELKLERLGLKEDGTLMKARSGNTFPVKVTGKLNQVPVRELNSSTTRGERTSNGEKMSVDS